MIQPVYITHSAHLLPNAPVSNTEMEAVLGLVGGKASRARALVLRSNGINSRHFAVDRHTGLPTHTNTQLTADAVRKLADQGVPIHTMQLLACGTTMPDTLAPGHAVMVHGELGTPTCEVASLGGICVSGTVALKHAYMSVAAGLSENAVATGSERASAHMRAFQFEPEFAQKVNALEKKPTVAFEKDFLRWMLSDGAGAFWLSNTPKASGKSLRIDFIDVFSYAHQYETCMYAGADKNSNGELTAWRDFDSLQTVVNKAVLSLKQDVRLLDIGIRSATAQAFKDLLKKRPQLRAEDIKWFLPHYSSEFFREPMLAAMPEDFKIPTSRWFTNLTQVGNVGAASIYLIIDELFHSDKLNIGDQLLCFVPESGRFTMSFIKLTVVGP